MITEFFIALFKAGIPVGAMAYLLTWWALRNGYLDDAERVGDIERAIKRLEKDEERRKQADPVQRKWLKFGGGFYGVVAMLTMVVIEVSDLWNFFRSLDGMSAFFGQLSLNLLINAFVESIKNFFFAIAWPVYWMGDLGAKNLWVWFLAAWLGYWSGTRLAARLHRRRLGDGF